jgi:sugar phosphate isomerase/epimerase
LVHANALPEAWLDGPERQAYVQAARAGGLTIASLFVGFDGHDYSNLGTVRATVGLVPPGLRAHRIAIARRYSDLAAELGIPSLTMHLGCLPHDPQHADYVGVVAGLRELLDVAAAHGQTIHLETGQESAADLLACIRQVDRPNLGVNFDPANFILYGTDAPLPALQLLYALVRGVHCKDGVPPAAPGELGRETPLGEGAVRFPAFLQRLWQLGYTGPLVIEHEQGTDVVAEILAARKYIEGLQRQTRPPEAGG